MIWTHFCLPRLKMTTESCTENSWWNCLLPSCWFKLQRSNSVFLIIRRKTNVNQPLPPTLFRRINWDCSISLYVMGKNELPRVLPYNKNDVQSPPYCCIRAGNEARQRKLVCKKYFHLLTKGPASSPGHSTLWTPAGWSLQNSAAWFKEKQWISTSCLGKTSSSRQQHDRQWSRTKFPSIDKIQRIRESRNGKDLLGYLVHPWGPGQDSSLL